VKLGVGVIHLAVIVLAHQRFLIVSSTFPRLPDIRRRLHTEK
jgi:hypothetical protein